MNVAKPVGSVTINQSSEMDVEGSIHEVLTRASDALRQAENSDEEISANSVDALLGRVSESSRCEIENVIDELQTLRNKLQNDRSRIRRDIMEYASLSQQVMQVTAIISDSVRKLPGAPGISR
jgi:conjugal transfer/entry exclusion protein